MIKTAYVLLSSRHIQSFNTAIIMKKTILLSCMCLGIVAITQAQKSADNKRFTLGPRLGLNYSTQTTQQSGINNDYILGYQAGGFMRIGLGQKSYLQPEVYFNSKGSNVSFTDTQGNTAVTGKIRFSSVDVPLLVGRYLVHAKMFKLRLMAGPMVSFNLKTNNGGLTEYAPSAYEFKERIWGGQIGLGADIGNICLDARYETGFEKINSTLGQRPSLFNISVGFKIF